MTGWLLTLALAVAFVYALTRTTFWRQQPKPRRMAVEPVCLLDDLFADVPRAPRGWPTEEET